jgi:hypothetical protein
MSETTGEELLFVNGVDADTGGYLLPPLPVADVAGVALGKRLDEQRLQELSDREARRQEAGATLGTIDGVDATKIAEAGWAAIFPADLDAAPLLETLKPLLDLRFRQANATRPRYKIFRGAQGVRRDQEALDWLLARGVGPGPVDPDAGVPYYLLIVGGPEHISFQFQFDLDIQHAVGRICFDTLDEYANYARTVVAAEAGEWALPRRMTFFGVENRDDPATILSTKELVTPLADRLAGLVAVDRAFAGWEVDRLLRAEATKPQLARLLGGDATSSLLFTASHGAGYADWASDAARERQRRLQGALMCAEWPGPRARQPLTDAMLFAGDDLPADAHVAGLVAFFFACFGVGTPLLDDFAHRSGASARPQPIAPQPFIARLPQRLLGHPNGGALAVVGHVERAWGYSFSWPEAPQQTQVFYDAARRLLRGQPVGMALEAFNERYAQLGTELSREQTRALRNEPINLRRVVRVWTASNDARGYIIFGDPAVRLAVAAPGTSRPAPPPSSPPNVTPPPAPSAPALEPSEPPPATSGAETNMSSDTPTTPSGTDSSFGDPPTAPNAPTAPVAAGVPELHLSTRSDLAGGGSFSFRLDITPGSAAPPPHNTGGEVGVSGDDVSFGGGIFGWGKDENDESKGLRESLQSFADGLINKLNEFLSDVTTLNVVTYTSEDLHQLTGSEFEDRLAAATPRAMTRIKFDGDTIVVVPESEGGIDAALWTIHVDMVREAQAARAEMIHTALEAVAGVARPRG